MQFTITRRQYNIVLKQGIANLPRESGGFLGGNDFKIQAVLPIPNQHLYDETGTFAFTMEDVDRAHRFFKKHNMRYYGLYHTHPQGIAYPSDTDIKSGQRYHFILSLRDQDNPHFAAFEVKNNQPIHIPLVIISDKGHKQVDIHDVAEKTKGSNIQSPDSDADNLNQRIGNILDDKPNTYDKLPPTNYFDSDFSTLA